MTNESSLKGALSAFKKAMSPQEFYANVGALPMDSASVFIRPYSMRRGGVGPTRSLCPITAFLQASQAGRIMDNNQALACMN